MAEQQGITLGNQLSRSQSGFVHICLKRLGVAPIDSFQIWVYSWELSSSQKVFAKKVQAKTNIVVAAFLGTKLI